MYAELPTTLSEALGLGHHRIVAFTGGGGKTTAMYRLARELFPERVLVTTTTKIWVPSRDQVERVLVGDYMNAVRGLSDGWQSGTRAVGTAVTPEGKLQGVPPTLWIAALAKLADHVLVEADGAAGKPLTAPREYEPVIPDGTSLVVPIVGLDALGAPLDAAHVHRVAEIVALTGLSEGDPITPEAIARVMLDPAGNVKGAPPKVEIVPLVNKVDTPAAEPAAHTLAEALIARGARRVVLARLVRSSPVVAVVEAAPAASHGHSA
ncbi:MAG TPA: selenium cofactor biosynthesis protein YqeC [Chloroflexota bacterium]